MMIAKSTLMILMIDTTSDRRAATAMTDGVGTQHLLSLGIDVSYDRAVW